MLLNGFDPASDIIDRVFLGDGEVSDAHQAVASHYRSDHRPFNDLVSPRLTIRVTPVYSFDQKEWFPQFPLRETVDRWTENGDVVGIIKCVLVFVPSETFSVTEYGFSSSDKYSMDTRWKLCAYKTTQPFLIPKMTEQLKLNLHLSCLFASSLNIHKLRDLL